MYRAGVDYAKARGRITVTVRTGTHCFLSVAVTQSHGAPCELTFNIVLMCILVKHGAHAGEGAFRCVSCDKDINTGFQQSVHAVSRHSSDLVGIKHTFFLPIF